MSLLIAMGVWVLDAQVRNRACSVQRDPEISFTDSLKQLKRGKLGRFKSKQGEMNAMKAFRQVAEGERGCMSDVYLIEHRTILDVLARSTYFHTCRLMCWMCAPHRANLISIKLVKASQTQTSNIAGCMLHSYGEQKTLLELLALAENKTLPPDRF